jgi:cysteine protease ATG4
MLNLKNIIILGKKYEKEEDFFNDVFTRFYFSFRRLFAPTNKRYTSDAGFGCMIRSGSMVVAECFQRFFFGRSYIFNEYSCRFCKRMKWLICMFSERVLSNQNKKIHPFSINNLIEKGEEYGFPEGSWFAPSTVAKVYKSLIEQYFPVFQVYISDNTIFMVY